MSGHCRPTPGSASGSGGASPGLPLPPPQALLLHDSAQLAPPGEPSQASTWNESALPRVRVRPASRLGLVTLLCLCLFPVASALDPQLPEAGATSPPSPPAAVRPRSQMGLRRRGRKLQGQRDKTPGQGERGDRAAWRCPVWQERGLWTPWLRAPTEAGGERRRSGGWRLTHSAAERWL